MVRAFKLSTNLAVQHAVGERGILNPMPRSDTEGYKEYMREYMLRRYHERMTEAKQMFGNICDECGVSEDLEFDHIDPTTKSFTIGRMWSVSRPKFEEELAKCHLLCESCHKKKHASDYPCGTPQRYWRGCRCVDCKAARNSYHNEYKRNRRHKGV